MRVVAVDTVLGDIGMFVDEWSLVFHVAACAGIFRCVADQIMVLRATVRIVAIAARHLVLGDRMTRKLGKLNPGILMTGKAELLLLLTTHFLLWPLVQLVAIETTDFTVGMDAACPVMQIRRRGC